MIEVPPMIINSRIDDGFIYQRKFLQRHQIGLWSRYYGSNIEQKWTQTHLSVELDGRQEFHFRPLVGRDRIRRIGVVDRLRSSNESRQEGTEVQGENQITEHVPMATGYKGNLPKGNPCGM